jgi:hypothetical protein
VRGGERNGCRHGRDGGNCPEARHADRRMMIARPVRDWNVYAEQKRMVRHDTETAGM